jgi:hypothetical protein
MSNTKKEHILAFIQRKISEEALRLSLKNKATITKKESDHPSK